MELNKNPQQKELLWFGALLPVFVALVGYIVGRRTGSETSRTAAWAVGAGLSVLFWMLPASRRTIFLGFGYLTYPLGWVMTRVLLLLVYLGVVTPTGILMRMFGNDLLGRRIDRARRSYWAPHGGSRPLEDYFRQS